MRTVVEGVSKTFGHPAGLSTKALERVDFAIEEGEFVALVGPSGCGKSTLLNIMAGLTAPNTGHVLFEGNCLNGRPRTAVVFQELALFPWRTVEGNVCYGMEELGMARGARKKRARELISLVGLEGFESHYPHQLSGGMKQRTAIARALAVEPGLLLMDEPFSALDAQTRMDMQLELSRIHEATGRSVLYITHYIPEAVFMADRVIVLSGRPGTIKEIVPIELPRPRKEKIKVEKLYVDYLNHIWGLIRDMGKREGSAAS
jgi:NitT/TauT family transport system ATP-binding protein